MPTIFDLEESNLSVESKHLKLPVSVPRKSPTKRVYQQDQFKLFEEQDKIKSFDDINSMLTPPGYTFQKYDELVLFHLLETVLDVTEVTDFVRVDRDFNVNLFYKGSPLPQLFRHGRDCRLTKKIMMQNFPNYIRLEGEQTKGLSSYKRKYDAKLPKLYQIRGRTDVQYSRRAQRARIQEKKNIIVQCYSIFTSSTL